MRTVDELLEQAKRLSPWERRRLIDELEESLGEPSARRPPGTWLERAKSS